MSLKVKRGVAEGRGGSEGEVRRGRGGVREVKVRPAAFVASTPGAGWAEAGRVKASRKRPPRSDKKKEAKLGRFEDGPSQK